MEYSDANTQLENKSIQKELQGLSSFIKANHSFFIGSIMASFEIKHFRLDKSNQINFSTSENEVVNEKYEEAIAFYNESIDLDPEFIYSYYNRGYVHAILKNYGAALVDFTSCIDSDQIVPEAMYNRGLINIYLNKYSEGCSDLSKAGEMGIDNAYRVIFKYCKNQE
jgi:tetratricopeptide (TPR) repeat protein